MFTLRLVFLFLPAAGQHNAPRGFLAADLDNEHEQKQIVGHPKI
jgi:hypothetical protein